MSDTKQVTSALRAAGLAVAGLALIAAWAAPGARAAAPGKAEQCTRLPLSDIQVGREETITAARWKLDEYAAIVAKKRGWKATKKSAETVTCEDYLYLPLIGQEYKCKVTATFCATP